MIQVLEVLFNIITNLKKGIGIPPSTDDFLLQENGDFLLQENGDKIIL